MELSEFLSDHMWMLWILLIFEAVGVAINAILERYNTLPYALNGFFLTLVIMEILP